MFEIHLADDLGEHFINVRTMFGTGLYEGTTPNLGQSLKESEKCIVISRGHSLAAFLNLIGWSTGIPEEVQQSPPQKIIYFT